MRLPISRSYIVIVNALAGLLLVVAVVLGATRAESESPSGAERVLSVGGSITEIVFALGEADRLIARDSTSRFPPEAADLPDVGYMRALSPEGVLSVAPDLIIAEEGSGPAATIDVLEQAEVEFVTIPDGYDREAVRIKILAVAEALGVEAAGEKLAAEVDAALEEAEAASLNTGSPKKVLFILSTRGGRIMASGTNTAADGIITLAGGENAITAFEGYKLLTDEAVAAAAPDVILMMDRGDHSAPNEELFAMPSLITTPAAAGENVVRINGLLLLGFGPRTPEAVTKLNEALYGG
ncbi:MAG: ABC transporter substrate-binding protein [Pseudomonadota bacterium]